MKRRRREGKWEDWSSTTAMRLRRPASGVESNAAEGTRFAVIRGILCVITQ